MALIKEIFRAYDIRGIYPSELDESGLELIGKAFGTTVLRKGLKNVLVGRDNRPHSSSLANAFCRGIQSTGCDVYYTDLIVHPAIHYLTFLDGIDSGANITASHNPADYNGVKLEYDKAIPCYGDEIQQLYSLIENKDFESGGGKLIHKDFKKEYINYLSSKVRLNKKIKAVVYCGNAVTSIIYPEVLQNIGAEVIPLDCEMDSNFPNGVPDPEVGKFYGKLREEVLKHSADIGIGFDGDGDRVGIMDEMGNSYKTDETFNLIAKDILLNKPGSEIIYDVKSSQVLEDTINKYGGVPKMVRTGRSFILSEMFSGNAMAGVELSGHIYIKDKYMGFDDGGYAAARILEILDKSGKKLSELMKEFPKTVNTKELHLGCPDSEKFDVVEKIQQISKNSKEFVRVITIDGVRAYLSNNEWFLIRASNTAPYLSARLEALEPNGISKLAESALRILTQVGSVDKTQLEEILKK